MVNRSLETFDVCETLTFKLWLHAGNHEKHFPASITLVGDTEDFYRAELKGQKLSIHLSFMLHSQSCISEGFT